MRLSSRPIFLSLSLAAKSFSLIDHMPSNSDTPCWFTIVLLPEAPFAALTPGGRTVWLITYNGSCLRACWLCSILTPSLLSAWWLWSIKLTTRQRTPFLVVLQLLPSMVKVKFNLLIFVEDFVCQFNNITLTLTTSFLSCCSRIGSTELANKIVHLLPPFLTLNSLSFFTSFHIWTSWK